MAIALPGLDRLHPGPVRDLVEALHELYDLAGQPAARVISRRVFRDRELESVSHETISAVLRGTTVPAWTKVRSIVIELDRMAVQKHDQEELVGRFNRLWLAVRQGTPGNHRVVDDFPIDPPREIESPGAPFVGPLPGRNAFFTGRELLLDNIGERLAQHRNAPLVLYGLGGVGKTQLAREYVHRQQSRYAVVWWVPADSVDLARGSMVTLAERMDLPLRPNAEQTIEGLLSHLESQQGDYLLVFDGAEGAEIRQLMPTMGGHVLVTSRDPGWAHDSGHVGIEVLDFDTAEAIQFLRKRDPRMSGPQARAVAEAVGQLPLALEQVAALQEASDLSWDDLLTRIEEPGWSATPGEPAHYPRTVAAFLRLALDQLGATDPAAVLLFELFAWFGPEPVAVPLLRRGETANLPPQLSRVLRNPIDLRRAIAAINRFGLARLHTEDQRVEVQTLIRLALRDTLGPDGRQRAMRHVHEILAQANPGWPDDLNILEMHRAIAPHVLPSGLLSSRDPAAQRAVHHQIRYRFLGGEFEEARLLGEAAVTAWRDPAVLGPDHELVLLAMREWANACRALGDYAKSRELTGTAIARLRADPRYGDNHEHTLAMAVSYAADLRIAGEYSQALATDQDTYQRMVARYGADDPRAMSCHHNLAVGLRLLGDFGRAQQVDREELDRHRQRGDSAAGLLPAISALAEDLFGGGHYQDALKLQSPALDSARPALAGTDRAILLANRNLALVYRRLGRVGDAIDLLRVNYDNCVVAFGASHEYSLATAMSLANALRQRDQLGQAYTFAMDAVDTYQRTFGRENPLTLAAEINLAALLRARGDRVGAARADELTLRALRETVGDEHPFTIAALINLATDKAHMGDHDGALATSKRAYEMALEVHGPDHWDTLAARANLIIDSATDGSDVAPIRDEVLTRLRRVLGPDHAAVSDVASGTRLECDIEPPST